MSDCWLNGALVAASAARIDPADRGFTLGDGVFETVALTAGRPAHLALHLARLRRGAGVLGITPGWLDAAIGGAVASVAAGRDGVVRITLSRGVAARGLLPDPAGVPTVCICFAGPRPAPIGAVAAVLCRCTRRNDASPLSRIKSVNYLDAILARQEAAAAGAEDAIMLNTAGMVAGASAANLFARIDGAWRTPPVADGALPGIARHLLLGGGHARQAGIAPADLHAADAIILSNSLGLRAVTRLKDRHYADAGEVLAQWTAALVDAGP